VLESLLLLLFLFVSDAKPLVEQIDDRPTVTHSIIGLIPWFISNKSRNDAAQTLTQN
jgi:hypothetical protein